MDNTVKSFPKQKRKCITMNLTMREKFKHYRKSQLNRNHQSIEQHLSTDSSNSDNPEALENVVKQEVFCFLSTSTLSTVITLHC